MHEASAPALDAQVGRRVFERLRVSSLTLDIMIVGGVALVLGLFRLGVPSLWVDESFTVGDLRHSYSYYLQGYYWLYYTVEKPWTLIAGTSEWALRFPSVAGQMLSCVLLVVLGRRLLDRRTALVAGLLLATSPFMVRWSQQARGYTMVVALSLAAMLLVLRAVERGTRGAWALAGLAVALVIVWHPVSGLLFLLPCAVVAYQHRERFLPHGLLAAALVLVLGMSWAAQLAMRSNGTGAAIGWIPFPSLHAVGRAVLDVSGATGVGILLATIGLLTLWRAGRASVSVLLGLWAFSPFVLALGMSLVKHVFLDRYLIVAAPAFALLGGVALTGARRGLGVVLVAVVVLATAFGLREWYSIDEGGNWRGEDWRAAVADVRSHTHGPVVVVPWWASPAASYYGADVTATSAHDSVWVLVWSEQGHELSESARRPLGFGGHRLVERHQHGWRVSAQLWARPPR